MKKLLTVLAILAAIFQSEAQDALSRQNLMQAIEQDDNDFEYEYQQYESVCDSLLSEYEGPIDINVTKLPIVAFMPAVFWDYQMPDSMPNMMLKNEDPTFMQWLDNVNNSYFRYRTMQRDLIYNHPQNVLYNIATLPEPPKKYEVQVNPEDHTIAIKEVNLTPVATTTLEGTDVEKKHWLKTFNASLQFSQAYVSPNWYQGGNNNLNAILDIYYNVKLNPAYHKNLLFENTVQYRLGINSTPDDTLRNYAVSEDIFQINTVFGLKATKKWYYSVTGQFKTQLMHSYPTNSNNLRSAFLSPGELNIGLGMSYKTNNPKNTFTFEASISPLSYNLMICTNDRMNVAAFGIEPGKHSVSNYGSSAECKLMWKMASNITLNSRLFGFTNYERAYADWENTISFEINKYLTTKLFVHLRYDTDTPPVDDPDWKKLQVKEILSLGFAYKFQTK